MDFPIALRPLDTHKVLTTKEAARFMNMSHRTLEQWRWLGEGPPFLKIKRQVRYRLADLIRYQERDQRDPENLLAA